MPTDARGACSWSFHKWNLQSSATILAPDRTVSIEMVAGLMRASSSAPAGTDCLRRGGTERGESKVPMPVLGPFSHSWQGAQGGSSDRANKQRATKKRGRYSRQTQSSGKSRIAGEEADGRWSDRARKAARIATRVQEALSTNRPPSPSSAAGTAISADFTNSQ